jgi:NAD(P)-dependent dehydrogenase (short-subunit alcohol dehydrogenase family)
VEKEHAMNITYHKLQEISKSKAHTTQLKIDKWCLIKENISHRRPVIRVQSSVAVYNSNRYHKEDPMDFSNYNLDFNLKGRIALVTGAAQGLGEAISHLFAMKGADVILVDIKDTVNEVASSISQYSRKGFPVIANLRKTADIKKAVEEGIGEFGKIDILVNNAGIVILDNAEDMSEEDWDAQIEINLKAPFLLTQLVGRKMIKQKKGKIINIASQAGIVGIDQHIAYCSSKAALIGMTKVLSLEWGKYNINVNAVSPTAFLTEIAKQVWSGEKGEALKRQIPLGRLGLPEEVAIAVLYLASDASDLVTGENFVIDGGTTTSLIY